MSALESTREFFDQKAPAWDYHLQPEKLNRIRTILSPFDFAVSDPLLDLGCGSGILHNVLPGHLCYTELDLSYKMISRVKEYYSSLRLKLLQADAHELPLKSEQYETVICFQSFPHFAQPDRVTAEVQRVLKPGGLWIILHLMDHFQLNALHRGAGQAVAGDVLPSASVLAGRLKRRQFSVLARKEEKDLYLIAVRKK